MNPRQPQYIQFYPTLNCNLSCSFCFNKGLSAVPDVSLKDFELMVSTVKDSGVRELDILGGEPTLHHGFTGMADILFSYKMRSTISTNGCGDLHALEDIHKKRYDTLIRIGVSLNSVPVSEDLHEFLMNCLPMLKSVYKKKREFLKLQRSISHTLVLTIIFSSWTPLIATALKMLCLFMTFTETLMR